MTCLGVLDRGDRDKANETGLKEGGVIEMSNYSASIRDARSLRFCILLTIGSSLFRFLQCILSIGSN